MFSVPFHEFTVQFFGIGIRMVRIDMSFDTVKADVVLTGKREELLPQFPVFYRGFFLCFPAVLFPSDIPSFPETIHEIRAVREDLNFLIRFFEG